MEYTFPLYSVAPVPTGWQILRTQTWWYSYYGFGTDHIGNTAFKTQNYLNNLNLDFSHRLRLLNITGYITE
jgi:hypothetical protein